MEISQHYLAYPKKTLIVVTNNEMAKIHRAFDREIEEIEVLQMEREGGDDRPSGTPNSGPPDIDEQKRHTRKELYSELSDRLMSLLKGGDETVILCAPEANKNDVVESMHTDVMNAVEEVVPKNLASLPLDAVVRILQETRVA